MKAKVSPAKKAGVRTRNRLREHPGVFEVKSIDRPVCLNGEEGVLLHAEDGWFGWLPESEIELEVVE